MAGITAFTLLSAHSPAEASAAFGIASKWRMTDRNDLVVRDLAADAGGNVYVAVSEPGPLPESGGFIRKYTPDGELITQWGTVGVRPGEIRSPAGLATDTAGNVYVTDTGNDRIVTFDATGGFLDQWGRAGSGEGEFDDPSDITIDASDNVYVADTGNDRVQRFDTGGNFVTEWGGRVDDVSTDAAGNVYVASETEDTVQSFSSNGAPVAEWLAPGGATDVALDSSNNVFVSGAEGIGLPGAVQVFAPDGTFSRSIGCAALSSDEVLWSDSGVEVAPLSNGEVFAAGWLGNAGVIRFGDPGAPMPCKPLDGSARARQRLGHITMRVGCPSESCELRIAGIIELAGLDLKTRIRPIALSLEANEWRNLQLQAKRKRSLAGVQRYLKGIEKESSGSAQVEVAIKAETDATNNFAKEKLAICLRRPGPKQQRPGRTDPYAPAEPPRVVSRPTPKPWAYCRY